MLAPGAKAELRDEPHPSGRVLAALAGTPAKGYRPPDYIRIVRAKPGDGYRRVGDGAWDFVMVPTSGAIGFVVRAKGK